MSDYRYDAVVVKIHDGDTLTLDVDLGFNIWHKTMAIRLYGINAPELNTQEGKDSLAFLLTLILPGDRVILESVKDRADKYGGRWLGTIWETEGGISVNQRMIEAGKAKPWDGQGEKPSTYQAALLELLEEIAASDTWVKHTAAYEKASALMGLKPPD